jgi:hypothetical protein
MAGRSASDRWLSPVKAQLAKARGFDEHIDDPGWVVLATR